jgi:hypothetical protein
MDHISQNRKVLGFMRLHGSITPMQAIRHFKCYRLGARIYELKQIGYNIKSEGMKMQQSRFCKYSLNTD